MAIDTDRRLKSQHNELLTPQNHVMPDQLKEFCMELILNIASYIKLMPSTTEIEMILHGKTMHARMAYCPFCFDHYNDGQ